MQRLPHPMAAEFEVIVQSVAMTVESPLRRMLHPIMRRV